MTLLLAGFILSFLGSIPPGMISLAVAHTALMRGIIAALVFASGAATAEFFQAWIAVVLSDWFLNHLSFEHLLQWTMVMVFFGLAIYMFFFAKAPQNNTAVASISLSRQFIRGWGISIFNLMAIPYWFTYCSWLRVEGWWQNGPFSVLIFCLGITLGTMATLSVYAWLGITIVRRSHNITRYANRLIGLIFFGLSIKLLYGLIIGLP
jgi:threonine/homoserine/homoserine lactone efflux protein